MISITNFSSWLTSHITYRDPLKIRYVINNKKRKEKNNERIELFIVINVGNNKRKEPKYLQAYQIDPSKIFSFWFSLQSHSMLIDHLTGVVA